MPACFSMSAVPLQKRVSAGEGFLLISGILEGLAPILMNKASPLFPPVFFVAASVTVALLALLVYGSMTGAFRTCLPLPGIGYGALVGILVPGCFALILIGTRYTSGINTALLLQNELVMSLLIGTIFLGDRHTRLQIAGALAILCGSIVILWDGSWQLNVGDLLILLTTAVFPIGNMFAKRALKLLSSLELLIIRYVVGCLLLGAMSLLFEDPFGFASSFSWMHLRFILLYGLLVLTLSKLCWYAGLRVLTVSRASSLVSVSPAWSLLFAYLLLGEIPSSVQTTGFLLMALGIVFLLLRKDPHVQVTDLV